MHSASSSRAAASRSTSRTSAASRTAACRPTSSGSCRTSCGCCCAARSIWRKGEGAAGNCAWGSFRSPANPVLRDTTERVVIASKGRFDRGEVARRSRTPVAAVRRTRSTPTSSWPRRSTCGTSRPRARAASRTRRRSRSGSRRASSTSTPTRTISSSTRSWVRAPRWSPPRAAAAATSGYDLDPTYVDIARLRVRDEGRSRTRTPQHSDLSPELAELDFDESFQARATQGRQGGAERSPRRCSPKPASRSSPRTRACAAPASRSTSSPPTPTTSSGTSTCRARSRAPRRLAAHRHRVEDARARARARANRASGPLVFLTSHLPRKGSEGDIALAQRPSRTSFFDVIEMRSDEGYERLRKYAAGGHRRQSVVADLRTAITEIVTGLGMCGVDDVETALAARPGRDHQRRRRRPGDALQRRVEGAAPPRPLRRLVHERPRVPARAATRCEAARRSSSSGRARTVAPGDEVVPADLRVDHVYLVSCKYLSRIVVNASPQHLFDRLLTGGHGRARAATGYARSRPPSTPRSTTRYATPRSIPLARRVDRARRPSSAAISASRAARRLAGRRGDSLRALVGSARADGVGAPVAHRDRREPREAMLWRLLAHRQRAVLRARRVAERASCACASRRHGTGAATSSCARSRSKPRRRPADGRLAGDRARSTRGRRARCRGPRRDPLEPRPLLGAARSQGVSRHAAPPMPGYFPLA